MLEKLLDRKDAMRICRCSWGCLWKQILKGNLKMIKMGGRDLFRPKDLQDFIDRCASKHAREKK